MTLHECQEERLPRVARRISLDKTDDVVMEDDLLLAQSTRHDSSRHTMKQIHAVNRLPSWSSTEKDVTKTVVTLNTMDSTTVASQDSRDRHDSSRRRARARDECPLPQEVSIAPNIGASSSKLESKLCDDQIQVAIRVRPMYDQSSYRAWHVCNSDNGKYVLQPRVEDGTLRSNNSYAIDLLFDEHTSSNTVYHSMARPIVKAVLEGKHGTIFAYGQTGSGKTYSLHGRKSDPGLIELAAQDIFRDTQIQHFRVTVQYFEIYNEKVRDLIAVSAHQKGLLPELAVQEDGKGNVMVQAREECVQSVHDVLRYLQIGNKNRATFATRQNAQSSRSHAVVRFRIESRRTACGTKHVSVLNMIDLAGSENSSAAAVGGLRKREGGKINQSLLSLSQVVHALSLPQDKRPKYISFRNSKLTRILQPHLQGNAAIAVLCCISMHKEHVEESKSTLKFAADAKRIAVRPVVNIVVDNHEALISNLQQELAEAKKALCLINSRLKEEPKNEVSMAHANPVPAILDTRTHNVQCEIHNTSSASLSSSSSEASYLQSQLELAVSRVKFLEKQLLMSEELNSALVKSVKELEWRDNDHQALAQTRVGDVAVKSDVASDFVLDAMGDVLQMLVYCMLMQIVFLLSTGYALIGRVLKYSRHRTMDSTTSSPR